MINLTLSKIVKKKSKEWLHKSMNIKQTHNLSINLARMIYSQAFLDKKSQDLQNLQSQFLSQMHKNDIMLLSA